MEQAIDVGEHYFGLPNWSDPFRGDSDNRLIANREKEEWHVLPPPSGVIKEDKYFTEYAVDPVFASGSPFPVFPPHLVKLPKNENRVQLVDGGYTHNVPILAAEEAGGRQLLVVSGTLQGSGVKRLEDGLYGYLGNLVKKTISLFPFLFERAQELDKKISSRLFVAALSPSEEQDFPGFLEFTPDAVSRLKGFADKDFNQERRIGKVQSWGLPQLFQDVSDNPEKRYELSLLNKGWISDKRSELTKRLINKTKDKSNSKERLVPLLFFNEELKKGGNILEENRFVHVRDLVEKLEENLGWSKPEFFTSKETHGDVDLLIIQKSFLDKNCKEIFKFLDNLESRPLVLMIDDVLSGSEGNCIAKFDKNFKLINQPLLRYSGFIPAVVYDGLKLDGSFNEAGYEGAQEFTKNSNVSVENFELYGDDEEEKERNLKRFLKQTKASIVIVLGAQKSQTDN